MKLTDNKPATSLPWKLRPREEGLGAIDSTTDIPVAQAFQVGTRDQDMTHALRQQNAAYIVTACNAFPQLVAALRLTAALCDENGHAGKKARALLRSLGEEA